MKSTETRLIRLQPGTRWLRLAWWAHVGMGLGFAFFGSGLAALVALTLLVDRVTVLACEAAAPAAPDVVAAPFAFDPEAQARTFVEAMASNEFQAAYEMVALEEFGSSGLCEIDLEGFWRTVAQGHTALLSVERFSPLVYSALYDYLSVELRLTLSAPEETDRPDREAYLEVLLTRDGRIASFAFFSVLTDLGPPPESPSPPYAPPSTVPGSSGNSRTGAMGAWRHAYLAAWSRTVCRRRDPRP